MRLGENKISLAGLIVLAQAGTIDIAEGAPKGYDWGPVGKALLGILVTAAALALGYFLLKLFRERTSKTTVSSVQVLGKEQRRRISEARERGDHEAAGDLLVKAGAHDEAAEAYIKSRAFIKAAKAYESIGNFAQAIHYYKQGGEIALAAKIYADRGDHMSAAAEFLAAGEFGLSAEQYAEAGDERRAAENFERAGKYLKAAKYFEVCDVPVKAAENYAAHFEQALAKANGDLASVPQDREYAKRAAMLFEEAGDMMRAGDSYNKGGYFAEAAQCLRTSGDYTRAAQMLVKANQPLLAAEMLEQAGEEKQAFMMRAEAALEEGDDLKAAGLFRDAGEDDRAAKLFEEGGAWDDAAAIYEKKGLQAKAMELYEQAEMWAHAARCAEIAQKWDRAAELHQKAGDIDGELRALVASGAYFQAGQMQFEHRRYEDAVSTLSKIDSTHDDYVRGLELLGDVLRASGKYEKAYSKYRAAMGNRILTKSSLPLYYKMARSLEEADDLTGALEHYKKILAEDPNYEDVGLRTKAIRGRMRRGSLPGVASSGIFAAPDAAGENQRYEILEEVARGGMGIVYKARDTVLGRIVAFKVLGENLRDNETAVKYFLREARAAAALSHPNIVTVYDAGEQTTEYYMAMEFVEGTTLKELIRRKGALPEDQVRYIAIHCCRALHYAHAKGIIHRDIKSGNVMITRDKSLKIMDFGLAKFVREYSKEHTQQVGTPFYMSPEQIIGKDIDHRTDLYSLGCTIYECATGTVPFFKGDLGYHHVHTNPPAPRSINPALSKDIEQIILKMLEKNPADRYQTAKEIIDVVTVRERG